MDPSIIKEAGLTEGEAKVYLTLLKIGSSTTGPIASKSGVANSIIYRILDSLLEKGLVSYITKEKTNYYQAAEPKRILGFIEERKEKLDNSKEKLETIMPQLTAMMTNHEETAVRSFEGFKGFQTAWETYYSKLKKGECCYTWGVHPIQEERFHLYWQRDHIKRRKKGIQIKILFNKGTDKEILQNRNSYKGCEARYMPTNMKTPAWFATYKDVVGIFLQGQKPQVIQILNQQIADSFYAYFQELWKKSKPISSTV